MFKNRSVMGECIVLLNAKIYFPFISLHFTSFARFYVSFPQLQFLFQIANESFELSKWKYLSVLKKQWFMVHWNFTKFDSWELKNHLKVPETNVGTWRVIVYFLGKVKWIEFALKSSLLTIWFCFGLLVKVFCLLLMILPATEIKI